MVRAVLQPSFVFALQHHPVVLSWLCILCRELHESKEQDCLWYIRGTVKSSRLIWVKWFSGEAYPAAGGFVLSRGFPLPLAIAQTKKVFGGLGFSTLA